MHKHSRHALIRSDARAFEETLSLTQRKKLGQFFTGMQLGRVLAHLAISTDTETVLDPMAGTGDLLDATHEVAAACGANLTHLTAIEIDPETAEICNNRLSHICNPSNVIPHVISGDAFNVDNYSVIFNTSYDLVITNPPYVRYQSLIGRASRIRQGLLNIAEQNLVGISQKVWKTLVKNYSGLADLSIPAWLLSGLLVRPGGRLALVVPATWRSRTYADVVRYMLMRCFSLEVIVEDDQLGWFSDALVRTHLIVARRMVDKEIEIPLSMRGDWSAVPWVKVVSAASDPSSLVGKSFGRDKPEAAFASWCRSKNHQNTIGISAHRFPLDDEWRSLYHQARNCGWMEVLEQKAQERSPLPKSHASWSPLLDSLKNLLPTNFLHKNLITLESSGICVGQGLRTGCNGFFYVQFVSVIDSDSVIIRTHRVTGGRELSVPLEVLAPAVHRQAELKMWISDAALHTRVLDLRRWVLPEDYQDTSVAEEIYEKTGSMRPRVMPEILASHVRDVGTMLLGGKENSKPVSDLSAVRTNVRPARHNAPPRFWYMLPDFMPRHLPQAFVPRVIHGVPEVYKNCIPPILVDANFSTFWSQQYKWTPARLTAFLNSIWCRVAMESLGMPLGGGALKLEVVHLRKMLVPQLNDASIERLDVALGCSQSELRVQMIDRIILDALLEDSPESEIDAFARNLSERLTKLGLARQGGAA